jgi:hypothetical protein
VNGDGYDDVIVGAPWNDHNGSNSGQAGVYSGHDGTLLVSKRGAKPGDRFGHSVAGGIDVNGGKDDFIVGAPYADVAGEADVGKIYVYRGGSFALHKTLRGENATDRFGWAVAGVGRADGDSRDDFAVSAPYSDADATDAGKVYVYSGSSGALHFAKGGSHGGARFGWSIAGIGRRDSDDRSDLLVGSPWGGPSGSNTGAAFVLSGLNGSVLWGWNYGGANARFGWSVAGQRNVNGAASAFIVGMPNHDGAGTNAGCITVFTVADDISLQHTFDGKAADDRSGCSVACIAGMPDDDAVEAVAGARLCDAYGENSGQVAVHSAPH